METINELNKKYNKLVDELFEKVLCDRCMKEIKMGQVEAEFIIHKNEKMMLCNKCAEEIKKELFDKNGFSG